ncbi:NADH-quinone oxidoreductase subunit G/NADP-reducing hydrogenase subunit HndD [Sporomusaceae bacterium BoRhaA]|uniref:NADH-dependent [FeFe] hydrogenase, group A6 n=1 Tax=Pelorhabdus rhamnosifermentans TaxID=2772457 RepID=UPI001C063640|nr:NADH-dependent [FeFe] hydrogenase, group A6 [Pelorhabdus rhamnosifermentans]MBU2699433.1 NADH-quinone oxidoreductase subunit G/NADP-reducing hydrogenase subunit HndD [Pelorhabdus rhamnosifermentans]
MVNLTIDGLKVQVPNGSTILEASQQLGIKIPTLCYHPELRPAGACRICMVEVQGARSLAASCVYPVNEGMVVHTNTPNVREARRTVVELLLANHPTDCLSCQKNLHCELQTIAAELGIRDLPYEGERTEYPLDKSNPSLVRDQTKCIKCGRCVRVCGDRQGVHVYSFVNRGFNTTVAPAFQQGLGDVACTLCGQCATVCPTAAIVEKDDTRDVWKALGDPVKCVVVQTAPSVRVALGEALGLPTASIVTGKMVAALRRLGFTKVFDTDFGADLTIMEEGHELIQRITQGGTLPMITSCSPGWVNFIEQNYPDLLEHLSTAKSPMQMFGALVKTYYAEKSGINPADIVSVAIMPCTAKKAEAARPEMNASGYQDVDFVLTTRELGRMIKEAGIDFEQLPSESFDDPLGESTGAAIIFGATGGVMEAALRTVAEVLTGKELSQLEYHEVRGLEGIKEAVIPIGDLTVKVAVVHSLAKARMVMEKIRSGEVNYHFIEIMACPGGCIGGGGQPYPVSEKIRKQRMAAIYECDRDMSLRKSHENPSIQKVYREFLEKPLSAKSHKLLHTHYHAQNKF